LEAPFYHAPLPNVRANSEQNNLIRVKNFGAIGAVIGHEVMHAFDNAGKTFDKDGNLNDWWTKEDTQKYDVQVGKIVNQYDNYQVLGLNVSGRMTSGENLADLAGVIASYYAMENWIEVNGLSAYPFFREDAPKIFFVTFAELHREKLRDETRLSLMKTDEHSPGMHRVNGVLSNMPEFYKAFDVVPGDAMYREDRVELF
jgi:putative endopeptidase